MMEENNKIENGPVESFEKYRINRLYSSFFEKTLKIENLKLFQMKPLFIFLMILSFLLVFNSVSLTYAQTINAEGVTTIIEDLDVESVFDSIKKIYEISPSALDKGYSVTLNEKDAFKLKRAERSYYIIVWNITEDNVIVVFPGDRMLSFGLNNTILVDVNQNNELDIILELRSIESYEGSEVIVPIELDEEEVVVGNFERVERRRANFYIRKFIEKELIPDGDYFELFDVTVRLADETIFSASGLSAFITFENFGEGPSEIDIVYSIINKNGREVYRGVDSKIVQTEDLVVKDFSFLELPLGKYILRTEIFYGQNQTGDSEQDFEIIKKPFFSIYRDVLIFIVSLVILFMMVVYFRKRSEMNEIVRGIAEVKSGGKFKKKIKKNKGGKIK